MSTTDMDYGCYACKGDHHYKYRCWRRWLFYAWNTPKNRRLVYAIFILSALVSTIIGSGLTPDEAIQRYLRLTIAAILACAIELTYLQEPAP